MCFRFCGLSEILQVVPVAASQVLGRDFLVPIWSHRWKLAPHERMAALPPGKKLDLVHSMAVRLMNLEASRTHATIACPSWFFRNLRGFDLQVPLGDDLWQRMLMFDADLAHPVINDVNIVGIDLDDKPQKESFAVCELSEEKLAKGCLKRNLDCPTWNRFVDGGLKQMLLGGTTVEDITPSKKPSAGGDFLELPTMEDIAASLLNTQTAYWLQTMRSWELSEEVGVCLRRFRIAMKTSFMS